MSMPAQLARLVLDTAERRGSTVAVAESLTGGMVCAGLVDVPGSSAVFRGGVVAYATDLKRTLLGVDPDLLDSAGPVSPEVALAMARGVRRRLGSDIGVATTGVAGPGPQDGVPAGVAYVAVVGPGTDDEGEVRPLRLSGDRASVREAACRAALDLVLEVLTRR